MSHRAINFVEILVFGILPGGSDINTSLSVKGCPPISMAPRGIKTNI